MSAVLGLREALADCVAILRCRDDAEHPPCPWFYPTSRTPWCLACHAKANAEAALAAHAAAEEAHVEALKRLAHHLPSARAELELRGIRASCTTCRGLGLVDNTTPCTDCIAGLNLRALETT